MKREFALMLFMVVLILPGIAYAQEVPTEPDLPSGDLPINFETSHGVIILIGIAGGVTTAYLGMRKAKVKEGDKYKFNFHRFLDRVIVASITSIGLAITSAAGFVELNYVTMFLIYTSTVGTAELYLQSRTKGK